MRTASLSTYHKKRHFKHTPEPSGHKGHRAAQAPLFVIQKHAARRLHYDFRLEAGGVLVSWAVPKGPPTEPSDRRLAIQTEDHPLDYANFEGSIPKGEYGGGNVIIWDRGTYRNLTSDRGRPVSIEEGVKNGHVTVALDGEKLHGVYAMTRIGNEPKSQWIFIRTKHQESVSGDAVHTRPESIVSGRVLEDMGEAPPEWVQPMLATLVEEPFSRPGWIYEPKLDGERVLAFRREGQIELLSRHQKRLNDVYPEVVHDLEKEPAETFILDGEMVAYEPGTTVSSFPEMQKRMHLSNARDVAQSPVRVHYVVFDLLFLNGQNLTRTPLSERKAKLREAFRFNDLIKLNPFEEKEGDRYYSQACRKHWEGVIAKDAASFYVPGRSREWLKFKCVNEQEFVIGGYTDPQGSREGLGAILVGYYENEKLHYAGKVGTGFDQKMLELLLDKLAPLQRKTSPFQSVDISSRGIHWVEPRLVVEIRFAEWTPEGKLRQGRYLGLRDDKLPEAVHRERPQEPPSHSAAHHPAASKMASGSNQVRIDGKVFTLTHLEKVLYPASGFTKGQVMEYYAKVAPTILPHLRHRPLTLKRYPNGVEEDFFYEKEVPRYAPPWLHTFTVEDQSEEKSTEYCLADNLASLMWIVNLASLEMHCLLARVPHIDQPTMIAFDLDPGAPAGLLESAKIALRLHRLLEELNLESFPKTSGGKGLHVFIPLNTKATYEMTQDFAHGLALLLERQMPGQVVSNMRKELRRGKVLVDWSQNSKHKTTVAPYSLRARPSPSVSTPLTWQELEQAVSKETMSIIQFDPDQVLKRLEQRGDLYAPVQTLKQHLPRLVTSRR